MPDDQRTLIISAAEDNKITLDAVGSKTASNSTSFLSFDSFLENVSPAALPTMLLGKLMNVTGLFQQQNTVEQPPSTSDDELSQDTENSQLTQQSEFAPASSLEHSLLPDDAGNRQSKIEDRQLTTSPNDITTSTTETKNKDGEALVADPSQDYFNGTQQKTKNESNRKIIPLSGHSSLAKIPRAVTDAIKRQVQRTDNKNTASETSSASNDTGQLQVTDSDTRNRRSSLSALRHFPPFSRYSRTNNNNGTNDFSYLSTANTALRNNQADVSIISQQDAEFNNGSARSTRKHRAKSMGSMLISGKWHKIAPSIGEHHHQQQHLDENQHKHLKGTAWLSNKLTDVLDASSDDSKSDINNSEDGSDVPVASRRTVIDLYIYRDIENLQLKEKEQQTMNDQLNATFPMLIKTEQVEAGRYNYFLCMSKRKLNSFIISSIESFFLAHNSLLWQNICH